MKRAKPTLDYDGLFDAQTDGWNGERFVEAIYRDLSGGRDDARVSRALGARSLLAAGAVVLAQATAR